MHALDTMNKIVDILIVEILKNFLLNIFENGINF